MTLSASYMTGSRSWKARSGTMTNSWTVGGVKSAIKTFRKQRVRGADVAFADKQRDQSLPQPCLGIAVGHEALAACGRRSPAPFVLPGKLTHHATCAQFSRHKRAGALRPGRAHGDILRRQRRPARRPFSASRSPGQCFGSCRRDGGHAQPTWLAWTIYPSGKVPELNSAAGEKHGPRLGVLGGCEAGAVPGHRAKMARENKNGSRLLVPPRSE